MGYKVYKNLAGKVRVKHDCPHCGDAIENEITEAGHNDSCPTCGKPFVVPGVAERKKLEEKLRSEAAARKQQLEAEQEARKLRDELDRVQTELQVEEEAKRKQTEVKRKQMEEVEFAKQFETVNVIAANTKYPALELYTGLLQAAGWICVGLLVLFVTSLIGVVVFSYFQDVEDRVSLIDLSNATWSVIVMAAIVMLPLALGFFVMAQLIQLALDARRDLAKLVNQRQLDNKIND